MKKYLCIASIVLLMGTAQAKAQDKPQYLNWAYKFGFEERFRYEYKKDFDFNRDTKDNGSLFFNRERINAQATLRDEYLKDRVQIFVEGLDAQTGGYRIKATASQTDDFDLHQAYVNVLNVLGSDFDVKVGRQEFKYGKGRLLGVPAWGNRIRTFDGGVIRYHQGPLTSDFLYGQDVKYDDDKFNMSRQEEFVTGVYATYQEHKMAPLVDLYFLEMKDIKGASDVQRHTVGTHLQATIAEGTVLDVEVPYQFGHSGTLTSKKKIKSYAFHADISKSYETVKWKPKLMVSYDEASGDKDPNDGWNNSFSPVYQSAHEPYGILDFFRWQNVRNPELSLTLSPTDKFKFTPQVDFFWLQNKNDSWYNSSGTVVRTKTSGDRGTYVGTETSLRFYYDLTANIKLELGYAHFFSGDFVKDTGAHDDSDWMYTQTTLKF